VDSDDWLPAGTVPAVVDRLAVTAPDVLLLGHVEVRPDGQALANPAGPVRGLDRAAPAHDALRPELFRRVVDHLLVIAGNQRRLPARRRREFFGKLVEHYRCRLPAGGYEQPGGVAGLKHRLVRHNAYWSYAALRLGWRVWRARRTSSTRQRPLDEPDDGRAGVEAGQGGCGEPVGAAARQPADPYSGSPL
jgi:hypothetical protein